MAFDRKTLASFRVLVAMARADRNLEPQEVELLQGVLGQRSDLLDSLLAEDVNIDAEIALLADDDRRRVYQSAFALAYADGVASTDEVNLLKKLVPNDGERGLLGQVFGETLDTVVPGRIVAEADPVQRDSEITEDILKYSVLAAVAGAMPVPGVAIVADVAVVAIQAKMVSDIGLYWGEEMGMAQVRAFMASVGGSIGLRIAVNNLARLVPGWGSAFGAATSFTTTYALGRVAQQYFEGGRGLDDDELRSLYETERAAGQQRYTAEKDRIDTAESAHGRRIAELNEALATGTLSRSDYNAAIAGL